MKYQLSSRQFEYCQPIVSSFHVEDDPSELNTVLFHSLHRKTRQESPQPLLKIYTHMAQPTKSVYILPSPESLFNQAFSFSFLTLSSSSNFLLAFRIMSSLLRCSSACLSFLLFDHPSFVELGVSGDVCESFDVRLYRCIRSSCVRSLEEEGAEAEEEEREEVDNREGGWKEGGG